MGFYETYVLPAIMDVALAGLTRDRQTLVSQASGRVLEIGMGNAANLPYYTSLTEQVIGLEPCEGVVRKANRKLRNWATAGTLQLHEKNFELVVGNGESLQYADNTFDTVIASLVFCSIPNHVAAAHEAFRVLKPGGRLLFFEHVQSPDRWMRRIQEVVNPFWKIFACGCHLNRDTESVIASAGFEYKTIERYRNQKMSPPFAAWMIKGEAIKPV